MITILLSYFFILYISLGKENSFTISRQKVSSRSRKNLFGTTIREILTYEIIVKNNKNISKEIQIMDQLPISTSKDIEVRPINLSNGTNDLITGEVKWNIKLAANEVKKIAIQFEIKYP